MAVKGLKDWIMGADLDDEVVETYSDDFSTESTSIFENNVETRRTSGMELNENSNKSSQMVVFEPRSYSESQSIADHLKDCKGCIINLHRVSKDQAKRIIDFLSGVVYAIEGEVQKVGPNVFLCTPSNFGVYGEISETEE
ncbi:cell division inhibitor SepF [Bacilli bacterium PM5-3]|nr:cell division inhibitor SepF [Bacilli bacterium PM5-3]MDH6603227.1 cell division inhibitor SepF [Bacilli bacterium PM5-9]